MEKYKGGSGKKGHKKTKDYYARYEYSLPLFHFSHKALNISVFHGL